MEYIRAWIRVCESKRIPVPDYCTRLLKAAGSRSPNAIPNAVQYLEDTRAFDGIDFQD